MSRDFEVLSTCSTPIATTPVSASCCALPRSAEVDSLCRVWRGANWYEREVFDLFGIPFRNHPNLERIMMPAMRMTIPTSLMIRLMKAWAAEVVALELALGSRKAARHRWCLSAQEERRIDDGDQEPRPDRLLAVHEGEGEEDQWEEDRRALADLAPGRRSDLSHRPGIAPFLRRALGDCFPFLTGACSTSSGSTSTSWPSPST